MLFELSIHQRILKNISQFQQKYEAVFRIDNYNKHLNSKSAYQNDIWWIMCDTEDWSNDAENAAFYPRNKLHFEIVK